MSYLKNLSKRNIEGFSVDLIKSGIHDVELDSFSRAAQLFELGIELCVFVDDTLFQGQLSIPLRDKLIFEEGLIETKSYDELFSKAFVLSLFYDKNCITFSNKISSFLQSKYSNDCTHFLYCHTLIKQSNIKLAYDVLKTEEHYWTVPSILFLKGLTKQHLNKNACADFYEALLLNNSSIWCAKYLFAEIRKHNIKLQFTDEDLSDTLTEAFIDMNKSVNDFEKIYFMVYNELNWSDSLAVQNMTIMGIPHFIDFLQRNEIVLLKEKDKTKEEYESYEQDLFDENQLNQNGNNSKYGNYNGYDDKSIDNAFEGDPENTWNVD